MPNKRDTDDLSFADQTIVPAPVRQEMEASFIQYAMSVITDRALPDVRDGLKPVHRRILYAMYESNLTHDKPHRKSATAVGDVMGNYHPHGDASIYDALVRLAQDFTMREPLIDGHGNFGSSDADPPAAMRYTEARLSRISGEMLRDIDKETIDWDPNYDETKKQPRVLPSRFPNLLVNGATGIAVGMATNIAPHNLREVIDAVICVLGNPEADLDDIMEHIKGPDFPTGGIVMGRAGMRAAYTTGRGKVALRARVEFEEFGQNRQRIVISELPYQVIRKQLIVSIAELVQNKKIDGISAARDESDRKGMRIVIELKREANPQVTLNQLYKHTQMQITFAFNMLALVDDGKQPRQLTLRAIIDEYIKHQREVLRRRTEFDLKKARERAHILEGLRIAVDNIDEVIRIIRTSYDNARENLMERFDLSEVQAQAILELQLRRLQGLEREKIEAEYNELLQKIEYYLSLLSDPALMQQVLVDELTEIRDKYASPRRTEIAIVEDEIDIEDLIDEEECVYTLTHAGYIKRLPANTYRSQRRGGRGITAMSTREEDYVETILSASTHDSILFFTNKGRAFVTKGYRVPEAGRAAKGTFIVNLLNLTENERVSAMLSASSYDENRYLLFITRQGTVKRMKTSELKNIRTNGIRAVNLREGDELISVRETDGTEKIIIATHNGRAICFDENDLRSMGRAAAGVRGIRLRGGDFCVGAARAREGGSLLTVTEKGYGKRSEISDYLRGSEDGEQSAQSRGGIGRINCKVTDKTGPVADVKVVTDEDDVLLISDDGTIIRMDAGSIPVIGRNTQGVRLMRVADGVRVIAVARTEKEPDEEAAVPLETVPEDIGEAAEDEMPEDEASDGDEEADENDEADENEDFEPESESDPE